ncbi:PriCT-2 domain-containing protein [Zeimonas arvi]|uniref:Primase C-terminal 2 domain-containing protein n=1 Tax=Zeimonas arvi TaxID=2498847 RepID=A0A5C8NSE9_9BURK|nr:PriCT-2 domain-containing protein [Zeimonas arvi]TXL63880.1 hypothetical protein FHP08_16440 [Zeimonas arvi]
MGEVALRHMPADAPDRTQTIVASPDEVAALRRAGVALRAIAPAEDLGPGQAAESAPAADLVAPVTDRGNQAEQSGTSPPPPTITLTVLRGDKPTGKVWSDALGTEVRVRERFDEEKGEMVPDLPYLNRFSSRQVVGIKQLHAALVELSQDPRNYLIPGHPVSPIAAAVRRAFVRTKKTCADYASHLLVLDVDNFVPKADKFVAACDEYIATMLPEAFHGASYIAMRSSSAGSAKSRASGARKLKAKIFFILATPATTLQIKAWLEATGVADAKQYAWAGQPIFIAAPEIPGPDPIQQRVTLVERGAEVVHFVMPPAPEREQREPVDLAKPSSRDVERIQSALDVVDPDDFDYDGWLRILWAVNQGTGGSEEGFAMFDAWSRRSSRYGEEETRKQWGHADPGRAGGITIETLLREARKRSWQDPTLTDGLHNLSVEGLEREARGFEYVVDVRYDFAENVALCVEEEEDRQRIVAAIPNDETRAFVAEGVAAAVEARSAVKKAQANKAPPLPSAVQLITQLQSEPRDNVVATWAARAAHLARSEVEDVIDAVERITRIGKRKLAGALNEARANLARQRAKKEFERVQAGRERIEVEAGEVGTMSQRAESAVVARVPSGGFLSFSGSPVKVEVDTLPCTHLIDDQDVAPPPVLQLKPFNESSMRTTIEENAIFMSRDARGHERREDVPANVIKNVLVNPSPRVPRVTGLISHPVVLPNGEIVAVDGLHAKTGLFLHGAAMGGLRPYTQAEAAAALARLHVLLFGEFEFASELDGYIAIAGLLTGFERRLMPSAPGLAVLASRQSSGKTTLARMIHVALTGHDMPVTTLSESSEELKKHLLAMLVRAPEMVCIDNIGDGMTFRSATLASIMTSSSYRDRRLGVSEEVDVRTETLWVITGNNLQLGADEITRWMVCRLEPKTSRPEEREFRNGDVVGAVRRARVQIIRDIVGIVAGYLASGASVGDGKSTRFKEWDRLVRLPIIWAGGADVTEVFRQNREQSPDEMSKVGVLSAIRDLVGDDEFYPTDVVSWLTGTAPGGEAGMPSAAQDDAMSRLRTSMSEQRIKDIRSTKSVGRALAGMANTTVEADGVFLTLRSRIKDGTRRYRVEVK